MQRLQDDEEDTEEEDELRERNPADELLRRHKVDVTESYVLGGY